MTEQAFDARFPVRARKTAERLFRENLYNCAESVLASVLLECGRSCPLEVVRMATPFGRGMGGAGCCCGALAGGQMALGMLLGRTQGSGLPPEDCARLAKLLHDRFARHNRATCCRILHKGLPFGTAEQFEACAVRAADAAELTAGVIREAVLSGTPVPAA